ncbi:MAG: LCP family protein [Gaiellales bacterium]
MATDGKPYRVYKGGRTTGRVPLQRSLPPSGAAEPKQERPERGPRRPRRIKRWVLAGLVVVIVLAALWGFLSYRSVAAGVQTANERVPAGVRKQLSAQSGMLSSTATTILVLGTDGGVRGRESANRSDSIMLIHTDPSRGRLAYLSIPRDLQVEIPDYGLSKINAASQFGGPALSLRTVKELTGLTVNHIILVDFARFAELIDAVGGIEIDVPRPIRSKRFDCPLKTEAQCAQWQGWRFEKGRQHLNGRRALIYSRIRVNELDPRETDFDRTRRQQQVVEATLGKATSFGTALRLPFRGEKLVAPLATDLTTGKLLQLGWAYMRANKSKALHCRLGGDPGTVGGESVILGSEDNVAAVAMFTGKSAPLPPPKGLPYAPGCRTGR